MAKKNVILLTIDTLRRDVLGSYGGEGGHSPFLDELAARSTRFTNCMSVGPYTQAAFPGILASSYYLDHPDHGKGKTLSAERTLVSEVLAGAGVAAAAFHSNPYLCEAFGWDRGWDKFYDSMDVDVTDEVPYLKGSGINTKVDNWLSSREIMEDERPLFLWAHYMDIHEPYVPDPEYVAAVDPSIKLSTAEMFALFKDVVLPRDTSDPATVELLKKLYLAHLREIDAYAREFFAILERHKLLQDALVIVTADHGEEFGDHGGLSHDGKMVGELLDVPLLIHDPENPDGVTCDAVISGADLPPTVAHLFGAEAAPNWQGASILPLADYAPKAAFAEAIGKRGRERPEDKPVYACREANLKICHRAGDDAWGLFDLDTDPTERENVMGSHPQAQEMKGKLMPRKNRS